ncbi:MAG: hypothetical protein OXJ55_03175 [Caldilineaceae bacterium]|nr:hypothetical protein [Caldilineaceae bacterium]
MPTELRRTESWRRRTWVSSRDAALAQHPGRCVSARCPAQSLFGGHVLPYAEAGGSGLPEAALRQGYVDCGEVANESYFERQGFAGIAVAATSLGFEAVAHDPPAA